MLFSAEKEKTAVRRVRFLNRLNYELTFAQWFDIINLWSLPSAIDGKRSKTVACHPASAEWRRVYSLAGNFSRGGYTYYDYNRRQARNRRTLQDVFWIVSIAWMLYQAWDKFHNRKK